MLNLKLENNNGTEFDFDKYQDDSYLLLIFFRGVWCNLCKKQLKEFQEIYDQLLKMNVKIASISSDTKMKSSLLINFLRLQFPVLSDEKLEIIKHFDLKTEFEDKTVSKPAILLISPKKETIFQQISEEYNNIPSTRELLTKIKGNLAKDQQ